jgi:uncharacterized membrane protein YgdD (TMEM256/DUF423 family)
LVITSALTETSPTCPSSFSILTSIEHHNNTIPLPFWTLGCIYGASSVTLGAFGAHGLKKKIADPARIANWNTAAHCQVLPTFSLPHHVLIIPLQLVHSGVLLLTSAVAPKNTLASSLFVAGMTMFSGSIYLLVLDPQRFKFLGPVTPLGGLCLIGGWVALTFGKRVPFPR